MDHSQLARGLDNKGQGTIEYIMVLGVALIIALSVSQGILKAIDESIITFGGRLERSLKTGKAPPSVYIN